MDNGLLIQYVILGVVFLLVIAYIVRKVVRRLTHHSSGCSCCSDCPHCKMAEEKFKKLD